MTSPLQERARGRWKSILPALGIDPKYLTGKNGPCPLCPGGHDRWRFDNKRGDGTWICTRCGAGQGIKLAMEFTRLPFKELAPVIERIIGEAPVDKVRVEISDSSRRASLNELWRGGGPVQSDDPVALWLRNRGLDTVTYPNCLRTNMRVRHSGPPVTWHPAMLAVVSDITGKPATIHKTYITITGTKAPVGKVRMFCPGSRPAGGAVRLALPTDVIGVAEGIETALAAMKMFGVPTWAALDASGVEKFVPPPGIERLVIFADNDENGIGQRAAYTLASRLSGEIEVYVKVPESVDTDWNDVVRGMG
jgi:putative DNA primase/helicase